MTLRGKDRWQRLPNVVAQLQAEAANPAMSPPRIAWPDEPVPPAGPRRDPATERAPANEPPANERIDWGGLCEYDQLAADPYPDLRALGRLLVDACRRTCGTRYRSIEPLLGDVNRRIDALLVDPDAGSRQARREALCKRLDRVEDLLVSLMVNS
jgi:hypothetical protein